MPGQRIARFRGDDGESYEMDMSDVRTKSDFLFRYEELKRKRAWEAESARNDALAKESRNTFIKDTADEFANRKSGLGNFFEGSVVEPLSGLYELATTNPWTTIKNVAGNISDTVQRGTVDPFVRAANRARGGIQADPEDFVQANTDMYRELGSMASPIPLDRKFWNEDFQENPAKASGSMFTNTALTLLGSRAVTSRLGRGNRLAKTAEVADDIPPPPPPAAVNPLANVEAVPATFYRRGAGPQLGTTLPTTIPERFPGLIRKAGEPIPPKPPSGPIPVAPNNFLEYERRAAEALGEVEPVQDSLRPKPLSTRQQTTDLMREFGAQNTEQLYSNTRTPVRDSGKGIFRQQRLAREAEEAEWARREAEKISPVTLRDVEQFPQVETLFPDSRFNNAPGARPTPTGRFLDEADPNFNQGMGDPEMAGSAGYPGAVESFPGGIEVGVDTPSFNSVDDILEHQHGRTAVGRDAAELAESADDIPGRPFSMDPPEVRINKGLERVDDFSGDRYDRKLRHLEDIGLDKDEIIRAENGEMMTREQAIRQNLQELGEDGKLYPSDGVTLEGFYSPATSDVPVRPNGMSAIDIQDAEALAKNRARQASLEAQIPAGGDFADSFTDAFPQYKGQFDRVVGMTEKGAVTVRLKNGKEIGVLRNEVKGVDIPFGDENDLAGYGRTLRNPDRFDAEGNFIGRKGGDVVDSADDATPKTSPTLRKAGEDYEIVQDGKVVGKVYKSWFRNGGDGWTHNGLSGHKTLNDVLKDFTRRQARGNTHSSLVKKADDVSGPRPYKDLTPEVHKRYEVYDEKGNLIEKSYDYDEAHRWADQNDGYVKDVGDKADDIIETADDVAPKKKSLQEFHKDLMQKIKDGIPAAKEQFALDAAITRVYKSLNPGLKLEPGNARALKALQILRAIRPKTINPDGWQFKNYPRHILEDAKKIKELSYGKLPMEIEDIVENYLETGRVELPDPVDRIHPGLGVVETAHDTAPKLGPVGKAPTIEDIASGKAAMPTGVAEAQKAAATAPTGRPKSIADPRVRGELPEKPSFVQRRKEDLKDIGRQGKRMFFESAGRELEKYGDSGKQLLHLARRTDADAAGFAGELTANLEVATQGFSKTDIETFINVIEGKTKTSDARILKAVDVYRKNDAKLTALAKDSDLHVKSGGGKFTPFEGRENYYPHKYDEGYFDSPDVQAKMIDDLMKEHEVSRKTAESIIAKARTNNPRVIDPLNRRQFSFEGYRKDLDVIKGHYQDMAQRAFESKNFGWRDLGGDIQTPVNELLEKIKGERGLGDWQRASEIMSKYLGRDEFKANRAADFVTKVQAATKLALSAPSNIAGGLSMTAFRAGPIDMATAALKAFTKEGKLEAKRLGTLQSLFKDAANDAGYGNWLSKAYGINAAEQYLRTVSALAGKSEAQQIFAKLKNNPNVFDAKGLRTQLSDLVLDDVDEVLKQESLSSEQIKRAANRFTDLTQGRSNVMDLPLAWSNNPTANVLTQFKKFAFIQSKNVKDHLKAQTWAGRAKSVASLMLTMPIAGEIAGDIREGIKAIATGQNPVEAMKDRGGEEAFDRVMDNYAQAFALGMMSEGMETLNLGGYVGGQTTRDTKGRATSFLLGPTVSDTVNALGAVAQIPDQGMLPVAREAVAKIPAVGQKLKSKMKKERGRKKSAPKSPYAYGED